MIYLKNNFEYKLSPTSNEVYLPMTKLANKIININNRRTSMRLCLKEWNALDDVCQRENIHRNHLIELIENFKSPRLGLTYSTRLFLVLYYKSVARPSKNLMFENAEENPAITGIIKELN